MLSQENPVFYVFNFLSENDRLLVKVSRKTVKERGGNDLQREELNTTPFLAQSIERDSVILFTYLGMVLSTYLGQQEARRRPVAA